MTLEGTAVKRRDHRPPSGVQSDKPAGSVDEREFLAAARSGSMSAIERLLAMHGRSLYRVCYGILGSAEDAEDAVQETFIRALRGLPRFRGDSAVRTWLGRIAVNVCIDAERSQAASKKWTQQQSNPTPGQASPDATAVDNLQIHNALATLSPRHRTILLLTEVEEWSAAEIAQALQCTKRRIYYELDVARNRLAQWRLRQESDEAGKRRNNR